MSHTTHELHEMIRKLEEQTIELAEQDRRLWEEFSFLRRVIHRILEIEESENHYTVKITGDTMAISVGSTGTFSAQLEDNGNPIPLPSGSTFAWSADDTNAQLAPSADTLSVVVTVPATDTATSTTVTAETIAPDGNKVQGSVTVPIIPGVSHTFTVTVTQTA